jgi:hypothetical protein
MPEALAYASIVSVSSLEVVTAGIIEPAVSEMN